MYSFSRWVGGTLLLSTIILSAFFVWGCATSGTIHVSGTYVSSFDGFETLDDYGDWVLHARYGRVWRPGVIGAWRPFYHGHWTWSVYGWTWISYEPFGWMVYHHGNWFYDPDFGWVWIPGHRWSPAVVRWIYYGNYVGWAPLPPPGVMLPDPWDDPRWIMWNMVPFDHFHHDYIGHYVIPTPLPRPVQKTKIVRNAPDVKDIERIDKRPIPRVPVQKNPIVIEKQRYDKIMVPRQEAEKINKHAPEVQKKVLKSKPKSKKVTPP
jgi:hypothetical protein